LYYLACAQDPAYQGQLVGVALQVIRPAFPDNPNQGAIRLSLPAEAIEAQKARMLADINRYVVKPILSAGAFDANPGPACSGCGYTGICDSGENEETEEAG